MQLPGKLQELIDQMSSARQALLDLTSYMTSQQLDYRTAEDQWSISDILHHLALTDEASSKLAANMLKRAQDENLAPDPDPDSSVLNSLDEYAPLIGQKFQAPERVAPKSHLPASESLARLKASRERMLSSVSQLGAYDLSALTYPHPVLGNLNGYQWLVITGGHERRHTAQIRKILSGPGFPS